MSPNATLMYPSTNTTPYRKVFLWEQVWQKCSKTSLNPKESSSVQLLPVQPLYETLLGNKTQDNRPNYFLCTVIDDDDNDIDSSVAALYCQLEPDTNSCGMP